MHSKAACILNFIEHCFNRLDETETQYLVEGLKTVATRDWHLRYQEGQDK